MDDRMKYQKAMREVEDNLRKWDVIRYQFNNYENGDNNIIGISPEFINQPIYRYTSFDYLYEMFSRKKNVLVKPSVWHDPFERLLTEVDYLEIRNNERTVSLSDITDNVYGQCWSLSGIERDFLWSRCKKNERQINVRIETTIAKLFLSLWKGTKECNEQKLCSQCTNICGALHGAYISKIEYHSLEKIREEISNLKLELLLTSNGKGLVELRTIKPDSFDYEEEVRLLYRNNKAPSSNSVAHLFEYEFEPTDVLNSVLLEPNLSAYDCQNCVNKLNALGFYDVKKSDLYKMEKIVLNID